MIDSCLAATLRILPHVSGTNYWRNRILKVAKDFTDLQFAMADTDDFGHTLSQTFGVESGSKKDALTVTVVDANDKKYRMDGDFRYLQRVLLKQV